MLSGKMTLFSYKYRLCFYFGHYTKLSKTAATKTADAIKITVFIDSLYAFMMASFVTLRGLAEGLIPGAKCQESYRPLNQH